MWTFKVRTLVIYSVKFYKKVIDMNEDVLILIGWCMIAAGIVGLIIMEVI